MRVTIIPSFVELKMIVNHTGEVPWELPSSIMPWMYAPWPEARKKGYIEMEVEGKTLRALVTEVTDRYRQANVAFNPVDSGSGDIDQDYDVLINGRSYEGLPYGLDADLGDGDEVQIKLIYRLS